MSGNGGLRPKTQSFSVLEVMGLIKKERIRNPQCQRKKRWTLFPMEKGIKSNYHDYIKFLYETCSTVEAITWAKYNDDSGEEYYVNIDGNNRTNAIAYFHEHPIEIFQDNFLEIRKNKPKYGVFIEFLHNISYPKFMQIRYIHKTIKDIPSLVTFWAGLTTEEQNYINEEVEATQTRLKIVDNDNVFDFDNIVTINLVIFNKPTLEQLAYIFKSINSNDNPLSSSDISAATLLSATHFDFEFNPKLKAELYICLKAYYDDKNKDEILTCYSSDISGVSSRMNGCEFLISFQNYCNEKYSNIIPKFDGKALGLFHKLFDFSPVFFCLEPREFTNANIQFFCENVETALNLICEVGNTICPKLLDLTGFLKDSLLSKDAQLILKKNPMFLLIVVVIKQNELVKSNIIDLATLKTNISRILVFHFAIQYLEEEEDREIFRIDDDLKFGAGAPGSYFKTKGASFCKTPTEFGSRITSEKLTLVFEKLVAQYNKPYLLKDKSTRRRSLDFPCRFLLSCYYNANIPMVYTKKTQNVDHIFPWNSEWSNGPIDLDRLGNLIIMDASLNKGRKNNSIQYYYNKAPDLMKCLHYPTINLYDEVVVHEKNAQPKINSIHYNEITSNQEKMYINHAIQLLF
jgi:hypothetical protein